jgi:hypothetical protein
MTIETAVRGLIAASKAVLPSVTPKQRADLETAIADGENALRALEPDFPEEYAIGMSKMFCDICQSRTNTFDGETRCLNGHLWVAGRPISDNFVDDGHGPLKWENADCGYKQGYGAALEGGDSHA